MAKRKLNREEIALCERNINLHKKYLQVKEFELDKLQLQLDNWNKIKNKKLMEIPEIIEEIEKTFKELEGKITLTEYEQYKLLSNKFDLDNKERLENYLKNKVELEHRGLIGQHKRIKDEVNEVKQIILITQDQINNGVEAKEPAKQEPETEDEVQETKEE